MDILRRKLISIDIRPKKLGDKEDDHSGSQNIGNHYRISKEMFISVFISRNENTNKQLNLWTKTNLIHKMSEQYEEKILDLHNLVINLRTYSCPKLNKIGNIDEVPLIFDV